MAKGRCMLFANDNNENRIHINDTCSNREYYCPYCGATLTVKKGELRKHHFAHKPPISPDQYRLLNTQLRYYAH